MAVLATSLAAHGDPTPARDRHPSTSIFFVAKSQNRNQVHYAVHLDPACNAVGTRPVYGYWRMFERGGEVEPILSHEIPAYGVSTAQQIERTDDSTKIRLKLNAAPDRHLVVAVRRIAGRCAVEARTSIAGSEARLFWAYVKFGLFGVDYILLHGARSDGSAVEERL